MLTIPGREKIGKICKISGKKVVFFYSNFVHNFAMKCGECGEIMQVHRYSKLEWS